jgi:uncharacterized integral membrane protein (TIGR00697 family)
MQEMNLTPKLKLFMFLCGIFVATLLIGNLTGGKLFEVTLFGYPFVISAGMLSFPVTFLLTDVINEFYGKQAARFLTWVGFWVAISAFVIIAIAAEIPIAPFTNNPDWKGITDASFNNVFTGSQRILAASMVAYLIAQFIDIAVFHAIKKFTNEKMLFLRATGSTLASQLVDTILIQFLVWFGILPFEKIVSLVLTAYVIKFLVAVAMTPALYAAHAFIEEYFLDDSDTKKESATSKL